MLQATLLYSQQEEWKSWRLGQGEGKKRALSLSVLSCVHGVRDGVQGMSQLVRRGHWPKEYNIREPLCGIRDWRFPLHRALMFRLLRHAWGGPHSSWEWVWG